MTSLPAWTSTEPAPHPAMGPMAPALSALGHAALIAALLGITAVSPKRAPAPPFAGTPIDVILVTPVEAPGDAPSPPSAEETRTSPEPAVEAAAPPPPSPASPCPIGTVASGSAREGTVRCRSLVTSAAGGVVPRPARGQRQPPGLGAPGVIAGVVRPDPAAVPPSTRPPSPAEQAAALYATVRTLKAKPDGPGGHPWVREEFGAIDSRPTSLLPPVIPKERPTAIRSLMGSRP